MMKKLKQLSDTDTKIIKHVKLKELMTLDHSQYTVLRNVVLEKSEAFKEKESHDMDQKLMGPKSTPVPNAPSMDLIIAKMEAQAKLISKSKNKNFWP